MKVPHFLLTLVFSAVVFADSTNDGTTFTPSGYLAYDFGQFVAGKHSGEDFDHIWLTTLYLNIGVTAGFAEKLSLRLNIESKIFFDNFPTEKVLNPWQMPVKNVSTYIFHAEAVYALVNNEKNRLALHVGYFPFKYNPDSHDLGEYLFRTGTYPPYITGGFEAAFAQLLGTRLHYGLGSVLDADLLLTTEVDMPPYHDFNLTPMIHLNAGKVFTLGAAVQFAHLLSVDERLTTYQPENETRETPTKYIDSKGDTVHMSFRGIKPMVRAALDIKNLFGGSPVFGEKDLRLYAEGAVLGLKNYPPSFVDSTIRYDDIMQRIPIMLGFNVPTFKALDVFSVEVEWFGWKHPNSYISYLRDKKPAIPVPLNDYTDFDYSKDDWKYSVYLKKSLGEHFSASLQIARNHVRTTNVIDISGNFDAEESLTKSNHWCWTTRAFFYF